MYKHIIFDLDGTLLDSMYVWKNVGQDFLHKNNIHPPEHLREILKKQTLPETAEYFRKQFGLTQTSAEIVDDIIHMVEDQYRYHVQLKPYVLEYLKQQQQQGTKMCVLTASETSYIYSAMERLGISSYFEFITTCTETGLNKNSPAVYETAMERLGGTKETTAVFEDALYAVRTAKNCGFYVVGIQDDITEKDAPRIKALCDKYIVSFKELL